MDKEHELLIPVSSDECGGSLGEVDDSDEDIIVTHYPTSSVYDDDDDDNDDEEVLMENSAIMLPKNNNQSPKPPLPTISVTPHSPAAVTPKSYSVLEDSLQQVRELHESVQLMRNATANSTGYTHHNSREFAAYALNPLLAHVARLSASCPALNENPLEPDGFGGSLGSSPLHLPPSRKGSGAQDWLTTHPESQQRRKSWTALEDLTVGGAKKIKHHSARQRSISLSSMESEADESSIIDNVDGANNIRLLGPDGTILMRNRTRISTGGVSTHSLNEADLQKDFNKIKAKREAEQLRLLPQRIPLQKSVSTPSIIAVRDLVPEPASSVKIALPISRPSGTESETEEEGSRSSRIPHYDIHYKQHLHDIPYDRHSEKRRKRGSLFFRKKKDKSKKSTHLWVSACSAQICDICAKPLGNKPALYCETCGATVHQNSCKDNILDCVSVKIKGVKSTSKLTGFGGQVKNNSSKRGSGSVSNPISSSTSQILYDDKDNDSHHDSTNFPDDVALVQSEFLVDITITASDLCSDLTLRLHEIEPESWSPHVGKEIAKNLKGKDEVKRQEHIYEVIMTEKNHCMILLIMQKIFVDGLSRYFHLGPNLERMFPRLADLTELHLAFLSRLRQRQRESPIVSSIADILLEQFSKENAAKLKSAYGEFCSRHRDAVDIYKYYIQQDPRFGEFVKHCQQNPLLKKKGIPECILFVTQRLTKYPLLIEPLIKTSKDNVQEKETLQKALGLVKEILVDVDAQVAEKEKEDRKLEIYHRIDAKSFTIHRGNKFKKSDILQGNRSLKFEGVSVLMQGRGKMQIVTVIVLTDVLFFLLENSNKYTFFTPDNKAGVVSLQKLLVREKAGQDSRGIYLISSNPADPEMFELKVQKPKEKQVWIQAIREAVQCCPEEDEDPSTMSVEDRQGLLNAKQHQVRNLIALLRQNDIEQALLLEEKMALQLKLLAASGLEPPSPPAYRHLVNENADTGQMWKEVLTAVQEVSQLASSLYTTGTNLSRSVSSAGEHQSETFVSPILPKRAETFGGFDNNNQQLPQQQQQQQQQQQPALKLINCNKKGLQNLMAASCSAASATPDYENLKPGDSRLFERLPYRNCVITGKSLIINGSSNSSGILNNEPEKSSGNMIVGQLNVPPDAPALLSLGREQQYAAIQLSHYVYTLLCIISQLMTTNGSLQSQISNIKGFDKHNRHNQQLEELRNLQDKLSVEKANWATVKDQEEKELEEKRQELLRLQEQVRAEQTDITQQREQLYRKMEILTSQGLLISPNVAIPSSVSGGAAAAAAAATLDDLMMPSSEDSSPQSSDTSSSAASASSSALSTTLTNSASTSVEKRTGKENKWTNKSTTTTTITQSAGKLQQNLQPVKQQIPFKLVSRSSSGSSETVAQQKQNLTGGSSHQILPLRLSQDEKIRRTSSGYQRLSENSFSPPSEETTPTMHTRTGSSPATMQQSVSASLMMSHQISKNNNNNRTTNTYPKFPEKYHHHHHHHHSNNKSSSSASAKSDHQKVCQDDEVLYF